MDTHDPDTINLVARCLVKILLQLLMYVVVIYDEEERTTFNIHSLFRSRNMLQCLVIAKNCTGQDS